MQTLYTLYLIIIFVSGLVLTAALFYSWTHRKEIYGAVLFAWMMVASIFADLMFLGIGLSSSYETAFFFGRARFLGLAAIPVLMLSFARAYSQKPLTIRQMGLLSVIPVISMILLWTNDLHHLFFQTWHFLFTADMVFEVIQYTSGYVVYISYSYLLTVVAFLTLVHSTWQSRGIHRHQYLVVLIGGIVAMAFNVPAAFKLVPFSYPSLNQFAALIIGLTLLLTLLRVRVLDIRPIANDAVVASMEDGVLVLNPNDRVMGMNLAAVHLTGRTAAKVLGKPVQEVFEAQPLLLERLAMMGESRQEMEIIHDNTPLTLELRCSPIRLKTGDKIGRLILLRDVTAIKQAEAKTLAVTLEQAKMRMVSDFIAASSHDLRTPLSIIATSVYLLRKIENPDDRSQRLDIVEQQTWRLTRMIEQLHELVKLSQEFRIEVTSVQPGNLRKSLPPLLTELAAQKHITLNWNLPADAQSIPGDAALILSAFQKVLHNALVYTPDGGTVTIRSFMRDNHVVVEVEDTGVGIAPEHQPFIFEAFYKGDKARTGNESGVGLGLAMVKKIMDMHNGQVTFTSVPGQGSVFCLAFPVRLDVLSHHAG